MSTRGLIMKRAQQWYVRVKGKCYKEQIFYLELVGTTA